MSQGDTQHTNDIFKDKFKDFSIEPSASVWNNIESSMAKTKRIKLILFPAIGIAASILLFFITTWFNNNYYMEDNNYIYNKTASSESDKVDLINNEPTLSKYNDNNEKSISLIEKVADNKFSSDETFIRTDERKALFARKKKRIATNRVVIASIDKISSSQLAINNPIKITSKLYINKELEIIRRNLNLLNQKKNSIDIKPKVQFNYGQGLNGGSSEYIYPNNLYKMAVSEFSRNTTQPNVVTKPSVKINTDLGVNIELPLNKHFSIISGVRYISFSDDKAEDEINFPSLGSIKNNNESNNIFNNIITPKEINQSFANLEIPLQVKYYLLNKKVSIYVTSGIGFNFLIKNEAEVINEDGSKFSTETEDMTKHSYSGLVGLGISYNINKSLYFSIEPHFRQYFNSLSKNKGIKIKPSITNISFGMGFKF